MGLFSRKKPADDRTAARSYTVRGDHLLHHWLLDAGIGDPQQISILLGIDPLEQPDEEEALSEDRVSEVAGVFPLLSLMNSSMSAGLMLWMRSTSEDGSAFASMDDEHLEAMIRLLAMVGDAASIATLTTLKSTGHIAFLWDGQ